MKNKNGYYLRVSGPQPLVSTWDDGHQFTLLTCDTQPAGFNLRCWKNIEQKKIIFYGHYNFYIDNNKLLLILKSLKLQIVNFKILPQINYCSKRIYKKSKKKQ